ncbi:MAG TPA: glycosyltransferase family A protein [Pyrinomonadaceae bacterium]|nr:glycosyltransferase family A protein [Pyrinomonadaceae bacterium]
MNPSANPLISVVMPVYNALPFLDDSISSILSQTFRDFEFVILDDGSTDDSLAHLREWAARDQRIRLYEGAKRLGLSGSSNAVVAHARAAIVARMDADDVAHPDRLRRQWEVIQDNPDVVVVGTLCNGIDARGREVRPRDRWRLVRRSGYIPFPHGSAMFRRETFNRIGGYDETAAGGEDQDLFSRMAAQGRVVTLPDVLYSYRYHANNATLFNGVRAVAENHSNNGNSLAAYYMLGAMRLWAGEPPMLLEPMLKQKSLGWNAKSLMILGSALWGHVSPITLKLFLRGSIRVRDLLASITVKDGKPYEWRSE